jgi:hypothetical protein
VTDRDAVGSFGLVPREQGDVQCPVRQTTWTHLDRAGLLKRLFIIEVVHFEVFAHNLPASLTDGIDFELV